MSLTLLIIDGVGDDIITLVSCSAYIATNTFVANSSAIISKCADSYLISILNK